MAAVYCAPLTAIKSYQSKSAIFQRFKTVRIPFLLFSSAPSKCRAKKSDERIIRITGDRFFLIFSDKIVRISGDRFVLIIDDRIVRMTDDRLFLIVGNRIFLKNYRILQKNDDGIVLTKKSLITVE